MGLALDLANNFVSTAYTYTDPIVVISNWSGLLN
jgi:hypothetical protein